MSTTAAATPMKNGIQATPPLALWYTNWLATAEPIKPPRAPIATVMIMPMSCLPGMTRRATKPMIAPTIRVRIIVPTMAAPVLAAPGMDTIFELRVPRTDRLVTHVERVCEGRVLTTRRSGAVFRRHRPHQPQPAAPPPVKPTTENGLVQVVAQHL